MDLDAYLMEHCPVELVETIKTTDLRNPGDDDIYYVLNEHTAPPECEVAATVFLAPKISSQSDFAVVQGFLSAIASYRQMFSESAKAVLEEALMSIPANKDNGIALVTALRKLGVDQRKRLANDIPQVWSFSRPTDDDALPWHYKLYEYSLGDADALELLSKHIDATPDATDAYALLVSLNELTGSEVTSVLERFKKDPRLTRGPNGPSMPLGELIEDLLESHH